MTIDILTIFPEMFDSVLNTSILGRARSQGLIEIEATDIRPFSAAKHKNTDDPKTKRLFARRNRTLSLKRCQAL